MEGKGTATGSQPGRKYDDPTAQILSVYVSEAEPFDKELVESWKGDMEGILIFAGLFSASVTAFIIESYKTLKPDSGEMTVALLVQISQQLTTISKGINSSTSSPPLNSVPFKAPASSIGVNVLWFLSLTLALWCALSATLVQQWARNYLHMVEYHPAPHKRARVRAYLFEGVETFKVTAVVESIPTLLHAALLLFFVGLIVFLFPIHVGMACLMLAILAIGVSLYTVITILPIIYRNCPYQTPLSAAFWHISQILDLLWYWDPKDGYNGCYKRIRGTLKEGRVLLATANLPGRFERDMRALKWTLSSLSDHAELEPFVAGIPGFLSSLRRWGTNERAEAVRDLVRAGIAKRVYSLLSSCLDFQAKLVLPLALGRAPACTNAIDALTSRATTDIWLSMKDEIPSVAFRLNVLSRPNQSHPIISTLATCMIVRLASRLLDNLRSQLKPPPASDDPAAHLNDMTIWDICTSLPMDELDKFLFEWEVAESHGISLASNSLSASAQECTLHVLKQDHVMNSLRVHTTRMEAVRDAETTLDTQVFRDQLESLRWLDRASFKFVKEAVAWLWHPLDCEEAVSQIRESESTQIIVHPLVSVVRMLKMRTSSGVWQSAYLMVLHSFISQLLEHGLGLEDHTIILQTVEEITRPLRATIDEPALEPADPVIETKFIHLLRDAISFPTPKLHKNVINEILRVLFQFHDPTAIDLAIPIVSDYLTIHPNSWHARSTSEYLTSNVNRRLLRQLPRCHDSLIGSLDDLERHFHQGSFISIHH